MCMHILQVPKIQSCPQEKEKKKKEKTHRAFNIHNICIWGFVEL
jgi:hypothetical protein